MNIIVVIPTYNEKDNILKTLESLLSVFSSIKKHKLGILVVDANSPDGTSDLVKGIGKKHPNIKLMQEKSKRGIGRAYSDGMDYAFDTLKADIVITFDADLSHDPSVLPRFIRLLEKGAKQVIGTRYRKGGAIPENWGVHRKFLSIAGNKLVNLLYWGSGVTDFTSGYKAITKEVYKKIRGRIYKHNGYTFTISLNLEALKAGYKIEEVPYHFTDRVLGKSKIGIEYLINGFVYVILNRFRVFLNSRFGKVFFAGGFGAFSQLVTYGLVFRPFVEIANVFDLIEKAVLLGINYYPRFFVSQMFAIEVGIIVAFTVNNLWAFGDKKLKGIPFIIGFLKNHLVVIGAIIIQLVVGQLLAIVFGVGLARNYLYQIIGILVGLIWNFYFYRRFIWKTKL